jgi:hypothetical protein
MKLSHVQCSIRLRTRGCHEALYPRAGIAAGTKSDGNFFAAEVITAVMISRQQRKQAAKSRSLMFHRRPTYCTCSSITLSMCNSATLPFRHSAIRPATIKYQITLRSELDNERAEYARLRLQGNSSSLVRACIIHIYRSFTPYGLLFPVDGVGNLPRTRGMRSAGEKRGMGLIEDLIRSTII